MHKAGKNMEWPILYLIGIIDQTKDPVYPSTKQKHHATKGMRDICATNCSMIVKDMSYVSHFESPMEAKQEIVARLSSI